MPLFSQYLLCNLSEVTITAFHFRNGSKILNAYEEYSKDHFESYNTVITTIKNSHCIDIFTNYAKRKWKGTNIYWRHRTCATEQQHTMEVTIFNSQTDPSSNLDCGNLVSLSKLLYVICKMVLLLISQSWWED